jgi:hypothetical protein
LSRPWVLLLMDFPQFGGGAAALQVD